MRRKALPLLCAGLACGLWLCACAGNNGRPQPPEPANIQVFRLADNQPEGYPTVVGNRKFAELVQERTNGEIIIEVFPDAQLGDEITVVDLMRFGAVDFARVSSNTMATFSPSINALSLPYLYRDKEHMFNVLDGPVGDQVLESMRHLNLLGLCWYDSGARSFYSVTEITSPDDMKGLNIRVQETQMMMDLIRYLGGTPVPTVFSEVYTAMKTGVIDGAENNFPSYVTASHNEIAKFFIVDEHIRSPEMILVNTRVFDSLSEQQRRIIREAALEAAQVQRQEWARQEADYERQAIASGVKITRLTPEQRQAFVDAVAPVRDDYEEYADMVRQILETP